MKLGFLLCDHVQSQLQAEFGDYSDMFKQLLLQNKVPLEVEFFSVIDGQLPESIDACDVYMTSGSKASVNDEYPWIYELERFVWQLFLAKKGFVGICFGHQLLAKALGGKVQYSKKGWGVGIAVSTVQKYKSWMQPQQNTINLIVSHQEQVSQLPPGTEVLMGNEFCPYSMIQVDKHFLGLQGHPEFSSEYCFALMNTRKKNIGEQRFLLGVESLKYKADDELIFSWLLNFLMTTIPRKHNY